ncbi:MAG: hypothetical protein GC180_05470 [Bacteroidetes bacterium]|nr:hypothetical protein [Bacteroidota bacterium]
MIRVQSQYMGSLAYWQMLARSESVSIEQHDHFVKQTYRNRCRILGPNGIQDLIVPIQGRNKRQAMNQVKISYQESWVRVHLNGLLTAYRSAPYFDYLFPELETILLAQPVYLLEMNESIRRFFMKRIGLEASFHLSKSYDLDQGEVDYREANHPKTEKPEGMTYPQVFQEKFGFLSGAGVIDLLMNDLPGAFALLKQ